MKGTYLKLFESEQEFNSIYNSSAYTEPWVSATNIGGGGNVTPSYRVDFNNRELEKKKQYLTLEIISGGTFNFSHLNLGSREKYEYKLNSNDWVEFDFDNYFTNSFSVNNGDIIQLRGCGVLGWHGAGEDRASSLNFSNGGKAYVYGNAMSLIYAYETKYIYKAYDYEGNLIGNYNTEEEAEEAVAQDGKYTVYDENNNLIGRYSTYAEAEEVLTSYPDGYIGEEFGWVDRQFSEFMPSEKYITSTEIDAYQLMYLFSTTVGNGWLYSHPTKELLLPATTLGIYCYAGMFLNQSNMTRAPKLPATTLSQRCYGKTSPYGYYTGGMFEGCTNLNYIECLATDISANYCTTEWVKGVQTNGGTFKGTPSTSWETGEYYYDGIPNNWTSNITNVGYHYCFVASGASGYSNDIKIEMPNNSGGVFEVYYYTNEPNDFSYALIGSGDSYYNREGENIAARTTIAIDKGNNKFSFTIPSFERDSYNNLAYDVTPYFYFGISGESENKLIIRFHYRFEQEEPEEPYLYFTNNESSAITIDIDDIAGETSLTFPISTNEYDINQTNWRYSVVSGNTSIGVSAALSNSYISSDRSEITLAINTDSLYDDMYDRWAPGNPQYAINFEIFIDGVDGLGDTTNQYHLIITIVSNFTE